MNRFAKFAWFALGYNILVVLWGVFLRASKSGDGCGQHWLTCHGEIIPSAPEMKTVIEFSHRVTSGIAFLVVLGLVVWAFRKFPKGHLIRKAAVVSFVFIVTEALVGAGLVLTGNTADAVTPYRPFWAMGHLINTFILLAALSLTAWLATGDRKFGYSPDRIAMLLVVLSVIGLLLVGLSGSLAALSNMLFPSASIIEGIAKDFDAGSDILLRLRLSHPILSILVSVFVIFVAGWLKPRSGNDPSVSWWSNVVSVLILVQVAFGAATLLMLGPIVMQVGHLLLADAIWIAFVLLCASYFLAGRRPDRSAASGLP